MPVVGAGQARNGVDHQQRGVLGGVDRAAHGGNVGCHAGGGFVVHHAHRANAVRRVGTQAFFDHVGAHAVAPAVGQAGGGINAGHAEEVGPEAEPQRHFFPQRGKVAGLEHQHFIARAQQVDQRGFPGTGARRWVDDHRMTGLEYLLHAAQDLEAQAGEFRSAVVYGGQAQRPQNPVGHRAGPRNLQEVAAAGVLVERDHGVSLPASSFAYRIISSRSFTRIIQKSSSYFEYKLNLPMADVISIPRQVLHQQVVTRLRQLIVEGRLVPGSKLNERALCEQLQVSRTPLREALKTLAAEGLVDLLTNRGAAVTRLSAQDIVDTFEVIASLEGQSGELAAQRITDAELDELRALHYEMLAAYTRRDLPTYYRLNALIHTGINAAARNPVLTQTYRTVNARLQALRLRSNVDDNKWKRAVKEHEQMIELLAARDAAGMRALLIAHIESKRDTVLALMRDGKTDTPIEANA